MRGIILFFLAFLLLIAAGCGLDPTSNAHLRGKISGIDSMVLTKVSDLNRNQVVVVARIDVQPDGSFEYTFEEPEPHLYELNFPNGKKMQFVTDGTDSLVFSGDVKTPDSIRISGSADNDKLLAYEEFRKESLQRLVKSVRARIKAYPDKSGPEYERLGKLEAANYVKHKDELFEYVTKNMGTSIAVYPTSVRWPSSPGVIEPLVAAFEKEHPNLEMTKRMNEKLATVEQTSLGGKAPDIKMRDGTGREISLYGSMGKYTLVDFWGSWCGPCRREAQTLSAIRRKYKERGFEIFGVGLESDLLKWQEAMAKDKRIWPNVLSLKEFETEAAYDYGITSLPANFLIDSDGKIVARDIHDKELEAKLAELF